MKKRLLELIDNVEKIEGLFHLSSGMEVIFDVQEFTTWLQALKLQLQEIYDRTNNAFIASTLKDVSVTFRGWTDKKLFNTIKGDLLAIKDNIDTYYPDEEKNAVTLKKGIKVYTAFDEFELVEQIASSANGIVYKVKDEEGQFFALKAISKEKGKEKVKRFKNEIAFCKKYANLRIVPVIDTGVLGDRAEYLFYIMPLYESNLRTILAKKIDSEEIIRIFSQIAEGLAFAHKHHCIHRDIKPENIFIDNKGNCVIGDFGIAHFMEVDKETSVVTKETSRMANFAYHAPEQTFSSKEKVSPATDIFALGLILNEMFTGIVPSGADYKKIADVDEKYSYLDGLVQKMLSQEQGNRHQSIEQLMVDFEARKQEFEKKKEISELSKPVLLGTVRDYLTENPIAVENITIKNYDLIIDLTNKPNDRWERIFQNSLGQFGSYPLCYKNVSFYGKQARYEIGNVIGYSNTNEMIRNLVHDFKRAVIATNEMYVRYLEEEAKEAQRLEIQRRKAEIAQLEQENQLNSMLKDLL